LPPEEKETLADGSARRALERGDRRAESRPGLVVPAAASEFPRAILGRQLDFGGLRAKGLHLPEAERRT